MCPDHCLIVYCLWKDYGVWVLRGIRRGRDGIVCGKKKEVGATSK